MLRTWRLNARRGALFGPCSQAVLVLTSLQILCAHLQRKVPLKGTLQHVGVSEFKHNAKTIMAEKLAYWLVDAVADELMSSAFKTYRPIIMETLKLTQNFLNGALSFLSQINSIGGLSRAGFTTAAGLPVCSLCLVHSISSGQVEMLPIAKQCHKPNDSSCCSFAQSDYVIAPYVQEFWCTEDLLSWQVPPKQARLLSLLVLPL